MRLRAVLPALFAAAALVPAACSYDVRLQTLPEITFAHRPPLTLNVAAVETVSTHAASSDPARIEDRLPTPPEAALRRWAADRLRATGPSGLARFTITDASVTETRLPMTGGVVGLFRDDQAERYDAAAEATLELFDDLGTRLAFAQARAVRSRSLREGATLDERDRLRFELVESLMRAFDEEMEKAARRYLGPWLL